MARTSRGRKNSPMLSSLLDSIKGQFSKSYLLGSLFPLILFLAANAFLASRHFPWVANWLPKAEGLDQKTLLYAAIFATVLALGYILSAINSMLLEALEGKIGPFRWAAGLLYAAGQSSLGRLDGAYETASARQSDVERLQKAWKKKLWPSLRIRPRPPLISAAQGFSWPGSPLGKKMSSIRWRRRHGWQIPPELLRQAVDDLAEAFRRNRGALLTGAFYDLRGAISYSLDRYQFEKRRLLRQRQTNFPGVRPTAVDQPEGPSSNNILAPTLMGNIGRTMRSYALVRYQLDLDIFWTRLQNSLQRDAKDYYNVLQDTKIQVDFAVTSFWLSLMFTLFWSPALLWLVKDATVTEFLAVGLLETVFVLGAYVLACQSYRVFTDVMRSSVDLFRFQMLTDLHLPLPVGSEEERDLWLRLAQEIEFGDPEQFQYKHT